MLTPGPFSRPASASVAGLMSAADFSKLAAISGSNSGDVTLGTANGLSLVGQVLSLGAADGSNAGAVNLAAQTLGAGTKSVDRLRTLAGSGTDVAIGPNGDDNTGLWFPAADTINMVQGGTLRAQFASNGYLYLASSVTEHAGSTFKFSSASASKITWDAGGANHWEIEATPNGTFRMGNNTVTYLGLRLTDGFAVSSYGFEGPLFQGASGSSSVFRGLLGSSSGDVVTKHGTTIADGTVNTTAKLLSVRTGIGGTETERAYFQKSGTDGFKLAAAGGLGFVSVDSTVGVQLSWNSISGVIVDSSGVTLNGTRTALGGYLSRTSAPLGLYATGTSGITENIRLASSRNDAGLKCVVAGTEHATPAATTVLFQTAKSVSVTAANDAGNGTPVGLRVFGDGNVQALATLQLNGDGVAKPSAGASVRGMIWYSKSAGGVADTLEVCLKSAADSYSWVTLATG